MPVILTLTTDQARDLGHALAFLRGDLAARVGMAERNAQAEERTAEVARREPDGARLSAFLAAAVLDRERVGRVDALRAAVDAALANAGARPCR